MTKKLLLDIKHLLLLIALSFVSSIALAQPRKMIQNKNPYDLMFGLSWNTVNDNESPLKNLTDVSGSWNSPFLPTRFTVDKYIYRDWSVEGMLAFNKYKTKKFVNGETGYEGLFISGDVHAKFSAARRLGLQYVDPYLSFGAGLTYRKPLEKKVTPTLNLAIGTNIWLTDNIGIQFQIIGKKAIAADILKTKYNYFQYTAGVVYRQDKMKKRDTFKKKKLKRTKYKFKRPKKTKTT
jgi:hypothetical protein